MMTLSSWFIEKFWSAFGKWVSADPVRAEAAVEAVFLRMLDKVADAQLAQEAADAPTAATLETN